MEEMITKLQSLGGKTKLKIHQKTSDQMNYMRQSNTFMFDKNPSGKNAKSIDMIMHEALLLKKFLQTKQIKNENINY